MAVDVYANQGYVELIPTLNTLSFEELATFVSVFEKRAFLINRVEYFFTVGTIQEFNAEGDTVQYGLSTSNTFAVPELGEATIIDFNMLVTNLQGAGVASQVQIMPVVKDLSNLPGGGCLVPCRPIFLWMLSAGFAAAGELNCRIYFTVKELKAEEYWELVEATRLVGA